MKVVHKDVTLIGHLNKKLLEREWLQEQEIIHGSVTQGIETRLQWPGYEARDMGVRWFASNDRLVVRPINLAEPFDISSLSFLVRIFEILKYTPVTAMGYNLEVDLGSEKQEALTAAVEPMLSLFDQWFDTKINPFEFTGGVKYPWQNYVVWLQSRRIGEQTHLKANFHLDLSSKKDLAVQIKDFLDALPEMNDYIVKSLEKR